LVTALSDQRRGAPEAQALYEETPESIANRERLAAQRKWQLAGKPDKKQRRQIHRFKHRSEA
jgi:ribosome-associated heat shock protein Hsp15